MAPESRFGILNEITSYNLRMENRIISRLIYREYAVRIGNDILLSPTYAARLRTLQTHIFEIHEHIVISQFKEGRHDQILVNSKSTHLTYYHILHPQVRSQAPPPSTTRPFSLSKATSH